MSTHQTKDHRLQTTGLRRLSLVVSLLTLLSSPFSFAAHTLPNRVTTIRDGGEASPAVRYADLLRIVASAPAQGGLTADAMRKRLRILDACDAARDQPEIVLEDADYDEAVRLALAHPWGAVHPDLVKFTDDLKAAPLVSPTVSRSNSPTVQLP